MFNINDPAIWTVVTMLEFVGAFFLILVLFQVVLAGKNRS